MIQLLISPERAYRTLRIFMKAGRICCDAGKNEKRHLSRCCQAKVFD